MPEATLVQAGQLHRRMSCSQILKIDFSFSTLD